MELRVAGTTPIRRGQLMYLPLSFFRSPLGLQASWNARTGQIQVGSGGLTLEATIGREMSSVDGRAFRLSGAAFEFAGQPMLPARSVLEWLGFAAAQSSTATHLVIVPACAIGTSQETPYLKLLAASLRPRVPRRGERLGVIGTVLSATNRELVLREASLGPALAHGAKPLFTEAHPAYGTAGATIHAKLTPATRHIAPVPVSALSPGTPVLVSGYAAHQRFIADSVIDLAVPPPGATATLSHAARDTRNPHASEGSTIARGLAQPIGHVSTTAAQASGSGSTSTAVFSGQYGLPAFNWSSPDISQTIGCATLNMQATAVVGAGTNWDWPMRFSGSSSAAAVALGVTPESPVGYSFSTASGAVVSVGLTLQLKCDGIAYEVDLGGPTVGGALGNATSEPGPLYGQHPVKAQPTACLDVSGGASLSNAVSAWGFTTAGLELCTSATIDPAALGVDVSISGLAGVSGGDFAISTANDPLIFTGAADGPSVTLGFSGLGYNPPVQVGFNVRAIAANQVIYNSPPITLPSPYLSQAIGSSAPTLSPLVVPAAPSVPGPVFTPPVPSPLLPPTPAPCFAAPSIEEQPTSKTVTEPNTATFSAEASTPANCGAPIVQWYAEAPGAGSFSPISGATSTSYRTPATTTAMSGTEYKAEFTNLFGPTTTSAATLTVNSGTLSPTSTALSSSLNPSTAGESVTFTATVSPNPGGGEVAFTANGSAISGCSAQVVNSSGQATCTESFASADSYAIVAQYRGDADYSESTSSTLTQTVNTTMPTSNPIITKFEALNTIYPYPAEFVEFSWSGEHVSKWCLHDPSGVPDQSVECGGTGFKSTQREIPENTTCSERSWTFVLEALGESGTTPAIKEVTIQQQAFPFC
jgi:hypothetical protein